MLFYQYFTLLLGIGVGYYVWRWNNDNFQGHLIHAQYLRLRGTLRIYLEIVDDKDSYDMYTEYANRKISYLNYLSALNTLKDKGYEKTIKDLNYHCRQYGVMTLFWLCAGLVLSLGHPLTFLSGFVLYVIIKYIRYYFEKVRPYEPLVTIIEVVDDVMQIYQEKQKSEAKKHKSIKKLKQKSLSKTKT